MKSKYHHWLTCHKIMQLSIFYLVDICTLKEEEKDDLCKDLCKIEVKVKRWKSTLLW